MGQIFYSINKYLGFLNKTGLHGLKPQPPLKTPWVWTWLRLLRRHLELYAQALVVL